MLLTLALVLLILWMLAVFAFHVVGGFIHLLVVVALVAFLFHFLRGSRRTA